jgi:hypothetical protein
VVVSISSVALIIGFCSDVVVCGCSEYSIKVPMKMSTFTESEGNQKRREWLEKRGRFELFW